MESIDNILNIDYEKSNEIAQKIESFISKNFPKEDAFEIMITLHDLSFYLQKYLGVGISEKHIKTLNENIESLLKHVAESNN